jgi:hypothetical protein
MNKLLEIQIVSDVKDLWRDRKSGLFEDREWECEARWSAIVRKINKLLGPQLKEEKEEFFQEPSGLN